jgi:hypothetical protein
LRKTSNAKLGKKVFKFDGILSEFLLNLWRSLGKNEFYQALKSDRTNFKFPKSRFRDKERAFTIV